MTRTVRTSAMAAMVAALLSCQSTTAPAPTKTQRPPGDEARLLDLTITDAATVAPDANDTVVVAPSTAGRVELPVTYPRSVEEQASWTGTGRGTATLLNGYGQVVFKVTEGEAGFDGHIPAGSYTLRIDSAEPVPLLVEVTQAGLRHVRSFHGLGAASHRGYLPGCYEFYKILKKGRDAAGMLETAMIDSVPDLPVWAEQRYLQQFQEAQKWLVSSYHQTEYFELYACEKTKPILLRAGPDLASFHRKVVEGDYGWYRDTFSEL